MSHVTGGKAACAGIAAALLVLPLVAGPSRADTNKIPVLHIGTTEAVVEENVPEGSDATAVEATYRHFIRDAAGFDSDIVALENHEVLAERLASGKLQLGVFMGYEFAWAQARQPKLKVLAVSVNQQCYRYPALVVHRDSPVSALADLKGKTLALPRNGHSYGRLFVAAQSRRAGQDPGAYLGHIDSFEDVETPLDAVVDEAQQAAVVDRLGLEAYQRRKPGRFARLKKLSESPPMPPALLAYYDGHLDPQTVTRLRDDLTRAHEQTKGEQLLMLFRLTRFAPPAPDFERVLADTRNTHPAPALKRRTAAHPEADSEKPPHFPAEPLRFPALSSLDREPRQGEPEYYLSVFAFDTVPRRAQDSHTFATFIKSSRGSLEAHTISWFPRSKHIEVARTQSEPGMNCDLDQTLRFARGLSARVYEWGPYRIRPELYERGLQQIERLNSGRIQYKVLDGAWRPDLASNCIHAVSDIAADDGYLTVDGAFGVAASARVVEHLSRWLIQPGREHPSIHEKLWLSGRPIIRVAYCR
ncbi:MAG TPA: PhnD/SsuA/transferrin family substrate-binding protein [Gemmataceae bacterium]|jgi:ABC-type phosphate/phosphonate transport system substrate-binding protein|nr:PhnD/SsuA/transferrin family substrate-binding protein [Gemmataceae bacterium]